MTLRVAINGCGRIGRAFLRAAYEHKGELSVVAANDLGDINNLAYLLAHDMQGNNPANVALNATYADLGALIVGPTDADKNLGLRYFVNGAQVAVITLDTATSTTYTIEYVATNESGSATSTRTVIVGSGAQEAVAQATTTLPIVEIATSTPSADTTAPVITLIGDAAITLAEGDTFTDPGATARDDTDGDVTGEYCG